MQVLELKLSQILVANRVSTDLEDTSDIEDTIKTSIGQIQPIAVCELPEPSNGHTHELLAGGRRYTAFERQQIPTIFARIYPSTLTPEEKLSIELVENMARQDVRWDEECEGLLRLHELLEQKATLAEQEWSLADTAIFLGQDVAVTCRDLNLARSLKIPHYGDILRQCGNKTNAYNAEAKIAEELILQEKAKRAQKLIQGADDTLQKVSNDPKAAAPTTDSMIAIKVANIRRRAVDSFITGDMFKLLPSIEAGTFDIVEFDPDYGIDHVSASFNSKSSKLIQDMIMKNYQAVENDEETYGIYIDRSLKELKRVMKPDSWLLIWFSLQSWYELICARLLENGFEFTRRPAIWYKEVIGRASQSPDRYLGATYETFIYARLGDARINNRARGDVFVHKTLSPTERIHPTEKPIPLMQQIISTFAQPNQKILIPHAGSGNSIKAALNLDMHPLGFDIAPEAREKFIVSCEKWEPMID